jgi:tRNA dimethylallyltransferase
MNLTNEVPRIVIAGPTGIGKTSASLELVRQLRDIGHNASIISADSRQCYELLNIGTGKISASDAADIRHYNISIFKPDKPDTTADFVNRARVWESEIRSRSEIPVFVGGSTLHLQSLIWPLDDVPAACVPNQIKLKTIENDFGQPHILAMLNQVDPEYFKRVEGYNRARIFRALDVYMQTGKPFSSFHTDQDFHVVPNTTLLILLVADREWHTSHMNKRVDSMIASGLIEETQHILDLGFNPELQSLQTVGYREVIDHIQGSISVEKMTELIKISTRQYAKRQATWFRRWKSAHKIDVTHLDSPQIASQIISLFNSF